MMVEVIDRESSRKMMMMVICGICYQGDCYLVYSIRRDSEDANVFVSKLINGSSGYLISNDFFNGEKEAMAGIVNRLLNNESRESLENSGFSILKDIKLDSNLVFDIDKCYVCTVLRSMIKKCLIYYNLVTESTLNQTVVEVVDDERKFNEGFVSSIALSVFGILILVFAGFVIYGIVFG